MEDVKELESKAKNINNEVINADDFEYTDELLDMMQISKISLYEFTRVLVDLYRDANTIKNSFPLGSDIINCKESGIASILFLIYCFNTNSEKYFKHCEDFINSIFCDKEITFIIKFLNCRLNINKLVNYAEEFKNNSFEVERTRNEILKLLPECLEMNRTVREIILSVLSKYYNI